LTIKRTFNHNECLEITNNQPESYTSVRQRNANKKEMKKQVFSELPLLRLLNKWKIIKKNKWTWLSWIKSIRSKERMAYSLEEDKEKGTKQREDCEWSLYPPAFMYLSIMVVFLCPTHPDALLWETAPLFSLMRARFFWPSGYVFCHGVYVVSYKWR